MLLTQSRPPSTTVPINSTRPDKSDGEPKDQSLSTIESIDLVVSTFLHHALIARLSHEIQVDTVLTITPHN